MDQWKVYVCVKNFDIFKVGDKAQLQKRVHSSFSYNSVIVWKENDKRVFRELDFEERFIDLVEWRKKK